MIYRIVRTSKDTGEESEISIGVLLRNLSTAYLDVIEVVESIEAHGRAETKFAYYSIQEMAT